MTDPVLVVGGGLIGARVVALLAAAGRASTIARRAGPLTVDVTTDAGRHTLRDRLAGESWSSCVLVHGPSDVTACENDPGWADAAHRGTAEAVADAGVALVLVSTDNVFGGDTTDNAPTAPVGPRNAYGRAKLAAENAVLAAGHRVVRVSLVYGPRPDPALRPNFAEDCLAAAAGGAQFAAPTDQWFTPVHVDDAAAAVVEIVVSPATAPSIVHVAGRETHSRHDFARRAYRVVGADPDLVRAVPRAQTRWASRPRHSGLAETASRLRPELAPRDVDTGLADTWAVLRRTVTWPRGATR